MKLTCQRCNHVWNYSGKNQYHATCPHCLIHVIITKKLKNMEDGIWPVIFVQSVLNLKRFIQWRKFLVVRWILLILQRCRIH